MRILITGALGMLGHDLTDCLKSAGTVIPVDIDDFNISDPVACDRNLAKHQPDIVVHSAAYTQVDDCETHIDRAMRINADGALNIAEACKKVNAKMLYFSTDYVFNGKSDKPWSEDAKPNPLSVYGKSKLKGEQNIAETLPDNHLIIRTSWLFGVNGKNFIDTVINLSHTRDTIRIVDDQHGCPTFTFDLAKATELLIQTEANGIFNVSNTGITTWFGLAKYVLSKVSPKTVVLPISTDAYPLPAPRPAYSALNLNKFQSITNHELPHWQNAVDRYLNLKYEISS